MLVVISPAKKLDENCDLDVISKFTVPPYLESSKKIIKALRGYSADNLSKLMNTSEKISELNLPIDIVIGAIVRKEAVMLANDDLIIETDDHVIIFVLDKKDISKVEKMFQVSVGFF